MHLLNHDFRLQGMLDEMVGIVDEYLADGGPLSILEQDIGGLGQDRLEFNGRRQHHERLHVIAMTIDITTRILMELDWASTDR